MITELERNDIGLEIGTNGFHDLLEAGVYLTSSGETIKIVIPPSSGKHDPARIKVENKDKELEYFMIRNYVDTKKFTDKNGKVFTPKLSSKKNKILKQVMNNNANDLLDIAYGRITENELKERIQDANPDLKVKIK